MEFNPAFASPDFVDAAFDCGYLEVDVCSHDIWAVGALFLCILTDQDTFSAEVARRDGAVNWQGYYAQHEKWVMPPALAVCCSGTTELSMSLTAVATR